MKKYSKALAVLLCVQLVTNFLSVLNIFDPHIVFAAGINVPATINAYEYNSGGNEVGYNNNVPGNQGNDSTYTDDVDVYNDGTNVYVRNPEPWGTDWQKYTINVPAAGWYSIKANGRVNKDMAFFKTATASGVPFFSGFEVDKINDGLSTTYAQASNGQVWSPTIDLGANATFDTIYLNTDTNSYPTDFTIELSVDGSNFYVFKTITGFTGGEKELYIDKMYARYIRLNVTGQSNTGFSYALKEFSVFNEQIRNNTNLAALKTVTSDQPQFYPGCELDKATDLDLSTYAQANNGSLWKAIIDLGATQTFDTVAFVTDTTCYPTNFEIMVSDDGEYWHSTYAVSGFTGGAYEKTFYESLNARYVAIVPSSQSHGTYSWALKEVQVYNNQAWKPDVSLNRTATSQASSFYAGLGLDNILDGDDSTYAQATGSAVWSPVLDLGAEVTFNRLFLNTAPGSYAKDFTIKTSDDNVNWITIKTVVSNAGGESFFMLPSTTARYIKLDVTAQSNASYAHAIKEINVYNYPVASWVSLYVDNFFHGGLDFSSTEFGDSNNSVSTYLSQGEHVVKIPGVPSTDFKSFTVSSSSNPLPQSPQVVSLPNITDQYVVADAVVTQSPYNADSTGVSDATSAIQTAIDDVVLAGGGTVVIPAGQYLVNGTLNIPNNVSVIGDWKNPTAGGSGVGTILKASYGRDNKYSTPFITVTASASIQNISVWYPDQHYTETTIHEYPPTIYAVSNTSSVKNITLYNSYTGIDCQGASAVSYGNIYMTALKTGIIATGSYEFSRLYNVYIDNRFWKDADISVITNAPTTTANKKELDSYTTDHRIGFQSGLNDCMTLYNVNVKESLRDLYYTVMKSEEPRGAMGGGLAKITGDIHYQSLFNLGVPTNVDLVPGTESLSYTFANLRKPTSSTLYDVKASYGAKGDGVTDDTTAIQNAIDAAYNAGGGIVYMPAGYYNVSGDLVVKENVELRGPLSSMHGNSEKDTCVLVVTKGKNTSTPDDDTAFITVKQNAGVRGFLVYYKEQGYGDPVKAPVIPYPYSIRMDGDNSYVEFVSIQNSYNGIEINGYDNVLLYENSVNGLNIAINLKDGSDSAILECNLVTYGHALWQKKDGHAFDLEHDEQLWSDPETNDDAPTFGYSSYYYMHNQTSFKFGECDDISAMMNTTFMPNIGYHITGNLTNSTFWFPLIDLGYDGGLHIENGTDTKFIGLNSTSFVNDVPTLVIEGGTSSIYGFSSWHGADGGGVTYQRDGGTLAVYLEADLLKNKPVTFSSSYGGDVGSRAVDGDLSTKWVSTQSGPNWIDIDLQQPSEIYKWRLQSAPVWNNESTNYRTEDIEIEAMNGHDSQTYETLATAVVGVNQHLLSDFMFGLFSKSGAPAMIKPYSARNVKLIVNDGATGGTDDYVRIPEFQVWGKEGFHFNGGTNHWVPSTSDVSNYYADNGRLHLTSTGNAPYITSDTEYGISVNANTYNKVEVKMKNGTSATSAKMYFVTTSDQTWDDAKSVTITTNANDSLYSKYTFDFTNISGWTGTIKQIRLAPTTSTGDIGVEYIKFGN